MFLDKVSDSIVNTNVGRTVNDVRLQEKREVYAPWQDWVPSQISHHGKMCCEIAREWVTATDFSSLNGECIYTGPRWLRQIFNWGASSFPIYWCEAVRKKTLDCGALAALAQEVFIARGIKNYRIQVVQKFSENAIRQWSESWNNGQETLKWVDRDLIYHEGCAIDLGDHKIKVWDASAGWWIDPNPADGYGSLLAIRVSGYNLPPEATLKWGEYSIKPAQWVTIK